MRKTICKLNTKILITFVIIGGIIASLFYFIPQTPEYSLYKIITAFKNKDYDSAKPYINIDEMVDNYISQNINLNHDNNSVETFGNVLALSFVEYLKPAIKEQCEISIKNTLENEKTNQWIKVNKLEIIFVLIFKDVGDIQIKKEIINPSLVKFSYHNTDNKLVSLKMKKESRNCWQIIDLN